MGINFPNAPTLNQLYPQPAVAGLPVYRWDGEKWTTVGVPVGKTPVYVEDAATVAEYRANSAPSKMLTPGAAWGAAAPVTLTDAATVTPDFNAGIDFVWTLGAAGRTLANQTGAKPGQKGIIYLIQDATGGRTITSWGTNYKFSGGQKPVLSNSPNMIDVISYSVAANGSTVYCSFMNGMA